MKWFTNDREQRRRRVRRSLAASVLGLVVVVSPASFGVVAPVSAQETGTIKGKEVELEVDPLLDSLTEPQRKLYQRKRAKAVAEAEFAEKRREADKADVKLKEEMAELNRPKIQDETPDEYAAWQREQTRKVQESDRVAAKKRGAANMAGYARNKAQQEVQTFKRQNPDVELPKWAIERMEREVNPTEDDNAGPNELGDQFQPGTGPAYDQAVQVEKDSGTFDGRRPNDPSHDPLQEDRPDRTYDPLPNRQPSGSNQSSNPGQSDPSTAGGNQQSRKPMTPAERAQFEREIQAFERRSNAYATDLKEYDSDVASHNDKLASWKSQQQMLEADVRAWQNDTETLESDGQRYDEDVARHNREFEALKAEIASFKAEDKRYADAIRDYNREVAAYEREVDYFNSLPPHQRSKVQYDRLVRWKRNLDARGRKLDAWKSRLDHKESDLRNRSAYIDSRVRQLDSQKKRLTERSSDLENRRIALKRRFDQLTAEGEAIDESKDQLDARKASLDRRQDELKAIADRLAQTEAALAQAD